MSKHTPGPWSVYYSRKQEAHIGTNDEETHIATCDSMTENNPANARLIATAPELYELAVEAIKALEYDSQYGMADALKAVIAKIDGGGHA